MMAITVEEFADEVNENGVGYAVTHSFSRDDLESIPDIAIRDAALEARQSLRFIEDDLYTQGLLS